ncbi:hypothetical protein Bca52824_066260 [Brassica carinata]|uniref:Sugar phosphate transporter domain-containing protein n=1 Tax=Brassica carinata TaxID=52824 RepID=A0A8X7QNP1_BRACI|nr:hypothetical protein Bca52824_066260 [Brassica carinata]
MINKTLVLTYIYLLIYIILSSGVILYNKWVLSPKYFNFPLPITLTMIHMGFSGFVAFLLIRVFKVVAPVKMTFQIYATCVVPISAFFASSLWFGNTAYLHIYVAFIQMLKALMSVATFIMAVICGTDKPRCDVFSNMLLVSVGVVISSYGEIHFNIVGTVYHLSPCRYSLVNTDSAQTTICALTLVSWCSFVFLAFPWYVLEKPTLEVAQIQLNFWIFFSNARCALALNFTIFLVIGRTGAVTIRVAAGVLKDWILIALSTVIFPESTITGLNIIGYAIALCGVVMYNYIKVKDVKASQSTSDSLPDRINKEWKMEKKSSDKFHPDVRGEIPRVGAEINDEEAPLITSRLSHIGRTQLGNHAA